MEHFLDFTGEPAVEKTESNGGGTIEYKCPHCVRMLHIPSRFAGVKGICNHCQGKIQVPDVPIAKPAGAAPAVIDMNAAKKMFSMDPKEIEKWISETVHTRTRPLLHELTEDKELPEWLRLIKSEAPHSVGRSEIRSTEPRNRGR